MNLELNTKLLPKLIKMNDIGKKLLDSGFYVYTDGMLLANPYDDHDYCDTMFDFGYHFVIFTKDILGPELSELDLFIDGVQLHNINRLFKIKGSPGIESIILYDDKLTISGKYLHVELVHSQFINYCISVGVDKWLEDASERTLKSKKMFEKFLGKLDDVSIIDAYNSFILGKTDIDEIRDVSMDIPFVNKNNKILAGSLYYSELYDKFDISTIKDYKLDDMEAIIKSKIPTDVSDRNISLMKSLFRAYKKQNADTCSMTSVKYKYDENDPFGEYFQTILYTEYPYCIVCSSYKSN